VYNIPTVYSLKPPNNACCRDARWSVPFRALLCCLSPMHVVRLPLFHPTVGTKCEPDMDLQNPARETSPNQSATFPLSCSLPFARRVFFTFSGGVQVVCVPLCLTSQYPSTAHPFPFTKRSCMTYASISSQVENVDHSRGQDQALRR